MEATGRSLRTHATDVARNGVFADDGESGRGARLGTTRHMAILVKDGLAMRLTFPKTRLARAAVLVAWAASAGCQKLPYIDQTKEVPHDNMGTIAQEDKDVKKTDFLSNIPAMPKLAKPRTTNDPEARGDLEPAAPGCDPDRSG